MLQITVSVDLLTEGNCYILSEENRCVIIDPGESEGLFHILEERQLEPELILLTHEHCDHMAGLDALREKYPKTHFPATARCDAGIWNVCFNMSRVMEIYLLFRGKPGIHYDPFVCRKANEIIPDDAVLQWRGHTLRYVPLPGHTPGSSGIFLDESTFFCGDYLIPRRSPSCAFREEMRKSTDRSRNRFLTVSPRGS